MTKSRRDALNRFAADVRASLAKYDNVSISTLNYRKLEIGVEELSELRTLLPGITTDGRIGPLGYIHFKREAS